MVNYMEQRALKALKRLSASSGRLQICSVVTTVSMGTCLRIATNLKSFKFLLSVLLLQPSSLFSRVKS